MPHMPARKPDGNLPLLEHAEAPERAPVDARLVPEELDLGLARFRRSTGELDDGMLWQ